jgi:hypothetical protein
LGVRITTPGSGRGCPIFEQVLTEYADHFNGTDYTGFWTTGT